MSIKNFIAIFLIFCLFSCKQHKETGIIYHFDEYELSYSSTFGCAFSMKFTQSDTVFISYQWLNNDLKDSIQIDSIYYTLISKEKMLSLNNYLLKINFENIDSTYSFPKISDGDEFKFYIKNKHSNKSIYFYTCANMTKELDSLMSITMDINPNFKDLKKINKKVIFKSEIPTEPEPIEMKN